MAKISTRELRRMCQRCASSVDAGLDDRAIWTRESQRGSLTHQQRMRQVADRIAMGESVADSLAAPRGYFPRLTIEMVRVGEQSGRLGEVFARLAEHYQNILSLWSTFLSLIWWPLLELVGSIIVIGLLIFALGLVAEWTRTEPIDVFGFGFSPSMNLALYVVTVTTVVGSLGTAVWGLLRGWYGPVPMAIAMKIPVVGTTLRLLGLSRFAWSFGMAIDAGMNAREAMRLGLASTQNAYFETVEPEVVSAIDRGEEFYVALQATGRFPIEFLDVMQTAELTGTITESLERLSRDYHERATMIFRTLAVVGGFCVMALVGLGIAICVIVLYQRLILSQYQELLDM